MNTQRPSLQRQPRPDVFTYLDYRKLLADFFAYCKATERGYSHRKFVKRAGLLAPNSLKRVIDGHVGLPVAKTTAFAKGFGLNSVETYYFACLVEWNQCKIPQQRTLLERKLNRARKRNQSHSLATDAYEFLSTWYVVAIRELIALKRKPTTAAKIAKALRPQISEEQAEDALAILSRLGLIKETPNGWHSLAPILETPDNVASQAASKYHHDMLHLARESIHRFSRDERLLGAVSAGFASRRWPELQALLHRQRKELVDFVNEDVAEIEKDMVIQINHQAFPLSARLERKRE